MSARRRVVRAIVSLVAIVVALAAAACAAIHVLDPETRDLDDAARKSAPGAFAKLSDGVTHYEVRGPDAKDAADAAPVVVLVAGFSVPYYIWDPTFTALTAAGFRVVRYDFYGRGFSDRLDVEYTQELYVRQIDDLLASLHIDGPIDLVGLSFGGAVVTSYADAHPDRVKKLVYFDPAFRTPHGPPQYASTPWLWDMHAMLFDEEGWATSQLDDFFEPEKFPDWPNRYREQMSLRGFRHARFRVVTSSLDLDQRPQLAKVGTHARPVLVICGKQDKSVSFSSCERLLNVMPQARLLGVDRAGHLPMWEQPALVHEQLIEFLHSADGAAGATPSPPAAPPSTTPSPPGG
jgi:pimeloyl-ACP methyl ester carboxylesterase